jgi:plasmid stabilization system protein ParE
MTYSVPITARALLEIDASLAWLVERSQAGARRWYERLVEAIHSLENNPERCGLAPENEWYEGGGLRQLLHGKRQNVYRILFEIRGDTVYILRVRHSAQALLDPGDL